MRRTFKSFVEIVSLLDNKVQLYDQFQVSDTLLDKVTLNVNFFFFNRNRLAIWVDDLNNLTCVSTT